MSHWNYRMTVRSCKEEEIWEIREIYYDDNGNVTAWSKDPIAAMGTSWRELADELSRMSSVSGHRAFDLDTKAWCNHKRQDTRGREVKK